MIYQAIRKAGGDVDLYCLKTFCRQLSSFPIDLLAELCFDRGGDAIGEKVDYDFQQTVRVWVALYSPESPGRKVSLEALTDRITSTAPSP